MYIVNLIKQRIALLVLGSILIAPTQGADYDNSPAVEAYINELTQQYGFVKDNLQAIFKQVKKQQAILDLIAKPAEKAKLWKEYQPIFLTKQRLDDGVVFWNTNADALARAEQEYGVPAQIIVAIIGVETFYSRNMGSWPVLDALTTLSFDYPQRSDFFKKQLTQYLLMVREEQLDPLTLKGSYAGAMGMCQFMPGSFREYAVDFDHDGMIDIWQNPTDAIGSVANYFKQHGWQRDQATVLQVAVTGDKVASGLSTGLELDKTVLQLTQAGWQLPDKLAKDTAVMAFRLDGEQGDEYWVGFKNFQVITRYNRSVMYSLVVYQLSEQLLAAKNGK